MRHRKLRLLSLAALTTFCALAAFRCAKNESTTADNEETAQQVGDVMASMDESGGSSGNIAWAPTERDAAERTFARLAPGEAAPAWHDLLLGRPAYATACSVAATFGACSGNVIMRNFGGCTVGSATFTGVVNLTWSGAACALSSPGESITREPAFLVTGRRGATLTVTKSGTIGQRLTWQSGAGATKVFAFSNDGIRRVFTASGSTLFDLTTETTSDISVSGTARTSRVISGGELRVTNNLTGGSCDFTPTAVTWSSGTCNCPISGDWSGVCSDGTTATIALTGCGTATLTVGSVAQDVSFDRCSGS